MKVANKILIFLLLSFPLLLPPCITGEESVPRNSLLVENIEINGNSKTSGEVVLSILDFNVGDAINKNQLEQNIQRVENSQFFKKVNIYTQPGSSKGYVVVIIEVKERTWPFFQFKGGYNELDGWYLSPLGLRFDNIFGHGNYMGIEFFFGDRVTGLDISYLRPDIFKSGLNFGILLYSRSRQFVHYVESQKFLQKVENGGLGVRINGKKGLLKYLWFDFLGETYTAEDHMWKSGERDVEIPLPDTLQPYIGEKKIGRFISSLNIDTRPQPFYPTSGWWGCLSWDQVSKQLGAFSNYNKWILDLRRYQEITRKWVFALRFKGGWIDEEAPFYDRFYLGGPNSVRGYTDRSLNPLGYATRLVQGSAELRFPLTKNKYPRHFLTGVLFYDIGQAWNDPDEFEPEKLNSSIGYGLRFNLPIIGLFRIDFAYPVSQYDLHLHVSLGHTF